MNTLLSPEFLKVAKSSDVKFSESLLLDSLDLDGADNAQCCGLPCECCPPDILSGSTCSSRNVAGLAAAFCLRLITKERNEKQIEAVEMINIYKDGLIISHLTVSSVQLQPGIRARRFS